MAEQTEPTQFESNSQPNGQQNAQALDAPQATEPQAEQTPGDVSDAPIDPQPSEAEAAPKPNNRLSRSAEEVFEFEDDGRGIGYDEYGEDVGGLSMSDMDMFEQYIENDLDFDLPERGDLREGTVVEMRSNEVLVNIGVKRDGIIPQSDLSKVDKRLVEGLSVGSSVTVVISQRPEDDSPLLLSISEAVMRQDWIEAERLIESNEIVEHEVVGFNKGGLTVEFNQLRGFVPASHVIDMPRNVSEEQRRRELENYIGQRLNLKVIEVERRRRRLVMSQMLAERELRAERKEELFDKLDVGAVVEGEVRTMKPFGAFVDIGGADGLLHVSEIGWAAVNHPRDVLEVGQRLEVQIIRMDQERGRIALSRKRLLANPWDGIEQRYHVGDNVTVEITRVVDFGAFAQLEPGVEGLIHISELADIAVAEPLRTVQSGDLVRVKILRIEPNRQRVGLSRRQADDGVGDIGGNEAVDTNEEPFPVENTLDNDYDDENDYGDED